MIRCLSLLKALVIIVPHFFVVYNTQQKNTPVTHFDL
nr:MAG TPA: hypothetical protein [Bacteriophage sp.]